MVSLNNMPQARTLPTKYFVCNVTRTFGPTTACWFVRHGMCTNIVTHVSLYVYDRGILFTLLGSISLENHKAID